MTEREVRVIRNYVLKADIEEMEFYEELFDHIASSYEHRLDHTQRLEEHLSEVITPSFGGAAGIEDMVLAQKRLRRAKIYKHAAQHFFSFFTTVSGLAKSLLLITILYLLSILDNTNVFSTVSFTIFLLPAVAAYLMQWRFKAKCRASELPYKTSFTNRIIFLISIMLVGLFQGLPDILSRIIYGNRFSTLGYFEQYDFFILPLTFIFAIYSWVCLSLIQHRVQLKLNPNQ